MKIIFFGTDENAKLVLKDLQLSSHNVVLAVTVPDKVRNLLSLLRSIVLRTKSAASSKYQKSAT
jgi:methionyl-tRNA formyltransferase